MTNENECVLVTGGAGYIGSVVVRQLLSAGYKVRALDLLRAGGESLTEVLDQPQFEFIKGDVRDAAVARQAAQGCWAIVHLAAIVGDPACSREPELARSTNLTGSQTVWAAAQAAGARRFVFASTCSNYGKTPDPNACLTEEAALQPLSIYAETKVEFERFLLGQNRDGGCRPTCLRFSTVYGMSPRVRFDLTVNEFTRELALGRELVVFGEQFWRPYCHVQDLARSVVSVLAAEEARIAYQVFNVGDTGQNYTKKMIVDEILKQIPSGKVKYVRKEGDPRDYRVDFTKIQRELGFRISRRVPQGIQEIRRVLELGLLPNPDDKKYSNI